MKNQEKIKKDYLLSSLILIKLDRFKVPNNLTQNESAKQLTDYSKKLHLKYDSLNANELTNELKELLNR